VVDQRADRTGVGSSLGERASGEATVLVGRDVLGPRLDTGLGDGADLGSLRRDGDTDAGLFGYLVGSVGDGNWITDTP